MIVLLTKAPTIEYVESRDAYCATLDLKHPDSDSSAFQGFMSLNTPNPLPALSEGDMLDISGKIDLRHQYFLIVDHRHRLNSA